VRLCGEDDPDAVFRTIPGVGAERAHRLHDELGVQTRQAPAHPAEDGWLERLPRIGARRGAAIRSVLAQMLDRQRALQRNRPAAGDTPPPVALLLDVGREYRAGALAGTLPTIAPARLNPAGTAWFPVLHALRPGWHVSALFSNTAPAHELGREAECRPPYATNDAAAAASGAPAGSQREATSAPR
jgi:hypothetical protein